MWGIFLFNLSTLSPSPSSLHPLHCTLLHPPYYSHLSSPHMKKCLVNFFFLRPYQDLNLRPLALYSYSDNLQICNAAYHSHYPSLGLFSRGKAHVLRLAVSIHLLLDFWSIYSNTKANAEMNADENPMIEPTSANNENAEGLIPEEEITTVADEEAVIEDEQHVQIGTQPIAVAASIVKTCLTQLCKF